LSIEPWNTAAGGRAACEDMPRKSIDKRLTDNPVQQKRGRLRPFPAIRRGRVRAEPANGSRDESLVGFGATPQGLKTTNICNFRGSFEPILLAQFFHRLFDTTSCYLMKCVHTRSSVSGRPNCSLPSAMHFIRNVMFLASTRIVCFPSPSMSACPGSLP